jgi:hypothetical protein
LCSYTSCVAYAIDARDYVTCTTVLAKLEACKVYMLHRNVYKLDF